MGLSVVTRSYNANRTGWNDQETDLTPGRVGSNLLVKLYSAHFDDDPRLEAQPLYVPGLTMPDGMTRSILYVCTMANNVWAFDAASGATVWQKPTNLGRPIQPRGDANSTEIDAHATNILWGVLSTPVIDVKVKRLYVVAWTSLDGTVASAKFVLCVVDILSGHIANRLELAADASSQGKPGTKFIPHLQKQRASLLMTTDPSSGDTTVFVAFGMTHEGGDPTRGWIIAVNATKFVQTATYCTAPTGFGVGVWQAGQGPAADARGDLYLMTGNYIEDPAHHLNAPVAGDFPQSFLKLRYSPPKQGAKGRLEAVAWFTPFRDVDRKNLSNQGGDDFTDYDLGSGGPVLLPNMNLVIGAGKDGVSYILDTDDAKFGRGSDYSVLKQEPFFFTYFPGSNIDASNIANLDHLYTGKTHHLHGSCAFWRHPTLGPMVFVWGENECLRAWTISDTGKLGFHAKGAEVASQGVEGKGGMPGGFPTISSNGMKPFTGIVWTLAPINGDANLHWNTLGILRAYDAGSLDPIPNTDGSPRLKLLWHSDQIPGNAFHHSKFCPPVVADGKVFVPTYDGRVDVYGLRPLKENAPTNARHGR